MASPDLRPVVQRTLATEAADRLRQAIGDGTLLPGTRLVERELAERLGVSRVPVREAIQRLEEEGLVKKVPHKGTVVYVPSREEIDEIATLRVVLESFVVERVIANWRPEHEERLRAIVEQMGAASAEVDRARMSELDTEFHHALWEMAQHALLLEIASSLRSRIARFLYDAISVSMPQNELGALLRFHMAGHAQLIDVLVTGDVAAARSAYALHIMGGEDRILAHTQVLLHEHQQD